MKKKQIVFRDNLFTFDGDPMRIVDSIGTQAGKRLPHALPFFDRRKTNDGRTATYDSTGAFLVGELERLDQTMHPPLAAVTFARDIDLREDVTIADEASSFTQSAFASAGGLGAGQGIGNGKAWIGKVTDQIAGVDVDITKIPHALDLWGMELKWTIPELESAAKLGRPVDQQKYEGLQLKHMMDTDEQVYIGDTSKSYTGLVNSTSITPVGLALGASGSAAWSKKSPDEILNDVNAMLTTVWAASAYAVMPNRILLPTAQFGYIATQKVSQAGNVSILKYILENNLLATSGQGKLEIYPVKWLNGAGTGGTIGTAGIDRAVCYSKDKKYVRFPMTTLARTPVQFDSIYHKTTYFGRLGQVEAVYPETIGYFDNL